MGNYASTTTVSTDKSRTEIESTLRRFGADQFMYGWEDSRAVVQFRAYNRLVRFILELPDPNDQRFTMTPAGRKRRAPEAMLKAYEQATRSVWRALALVIKAKLVAVDDGIVTFEQEFLAHIVLPSGETVGGWVIPRVAVAYETGDALPVLPGSTNTIEVADE